MKNKLRIGAVNWDAGLPADTYFGHYTLNTLGNEKYAERLPYYATKDENGGYSIPMRSREQYDEELRMAADAGIDFFMYCWYPDGEEPRTIGTEAYDYLAKPISELNLMRKLYMESPMNKRIKMCAIIITPHAYSKKDFETLVDAMKQDFYEKKDGRPLVFFFGGYKPEFISAIKDLAAKEGMDPYIVFCGSRAKENGDYSLADAVSAYASGHGGSCFEELAAGAEEDNNQRKTFGIPIIPLLSAGWNPSPRIDRPSPWVTYPDHPYAPSPTAKQMEAQTLRFMRWIDETPEASTGYGVVFAWNEFEEGGYLCPTLGSDGKPRTEILDGLSRALKKR